MLEGFWFKYKFFEFGLVYLTGLNIKISVGPDYYNLRARRTFSFGMLVKDWFYFPQDPYNYIRIPILLNQFSINTVATCCLL